jgi:hypothetical protein
MSPPSSGFMSKPREETRMSNASLRTGLLLDLLLELEGRGDIFL